jgi:nicotinate dehydrogenase subunit B
VVCDVEVDRRTGAVWARRFVVGHDCGIVVNPAALRLCIEGNVVQAVSRALWEEVQFDNKGVTSNDWMSYPILDMTEAPESVECVLINRPSLNPRGAGEPSTRPMAGAVANAIFEATGVRIRRAPFTPDRVKAALA